MELKDLRVETQDAFTYLKATAILKNQQQELFFAVENKDQSALDDLSYDAFLIGGLFTFMKEGGTLKIKGGISERLYFHLQHYFMKALIQGFPYLKMIEIQPDYFVTAENYQPKQNITGVSGGIDSFYTILRKQNQEATKEFQLNALVRFVPQRPDYFENGRSQENAEEISQHLGLPLIQLWTNLLTFVEVPFVGFSSYYNIACIHSVKKTVNKYYLASGGVVEEFSLSPTDSSAYDPLIIQHLASETLDIFCDDFYTSRLEKTEFISQFLVAQQFLDVCLNEKRLERKNCSKCDKCIRTMWQLETLGALNNFSGVFDVPQFQKNKKAYLGYLWYGYRRKGQLYYKEIANYEKRRGSSLPWHRFFWGIKTGLDNQWAKVRTFWEKWQNKKIED